MSTARWTLGKQQFEVSIPDSGEERELRLTEGEEPASCLRLEGLRIGQGLLSGRLDGAPFRARAVRSGDQVWVSVAGESFCFQVPHRRRGGADASDGRIEAPMPGVLLEVLVCDGQSVEEGQALIVVEAMKMEHRMRAPFPGVVRGLSAAAGERVSPGTPILLLEPLAEADVED